MTSSSRHGLGDFSTDRRVLVLALAAPLLGLVAAFVAFALLWLIAAITNLAYFGRLGAGPVSPAANTLEWLRNPTPLR